MSAEAKVGAFTLVGAALLVAVVIFFGGLRLGGGHEYTLYVGFGRAVGLNRYQRLGRREDPARIVCDHRTARHHGG